MMHGRSAVLYGAIVIALAGCRHQSGEPLTPQVKPPAPAEQATDVISNIEVKTFVVDGGWGYDIYLNDEKYIHQDHIPAVNGLFLFHSEADAKKVADLMVNKIRNNILPPSVSEAELHQLQIQMQ